jgi:hypothetical protein
MKLLSLRTDARTGRTWSLWLGNLVNHWHIFHPMRKKESAHLERGCDAFREREEGGREGEAYPHSNSPLLFSPPPIGSSHAPSPSIAAFSKVFSFPSSPLIGPPFLTPPHPNLSFTLLSRKGDLRLQIIKFLRRMESKGWGKVRSR